MLDKDIIHLSREEIRKNLLQYYARLLEVEESQLDFSDTSFSSFVINALSALTSDTLVYGSLIWNESTLVTAILPESIINWARYLDYTPKSARNSEADILIKIPLKGKIETVISANHKFYANDIIFIPKYDYEIYTDPIRVIKKSDISIPIPYTTITEDDITYLAFTIPVYQIEYIEEEFTIPKLRQFEFYSKTFEIQDYYIIDVEVYVNGEKWNPSKIIQSFPDEKVFEWVVIDNKLKISFGNNLFGKQPEEGGVKVIITATKGKAGNVGPGTINDGDPLYTNDTPPKRIDYTVINPVSAAYGEDVETLNDIKRNTPRSLSILRRIVSYTDYVDLYNIIYGEQNKTIPVLKRSDLTTNDIHLYTTLTWNDNIVPANTIWIPYDETVNEYPMFTEFTFEGDEYICPFLLEVDHEKEIVHYYFIPPETPLDISTVLRTTFATCFVNNGVVIYDYLSDQFTIKLYVLYNDSTVSITQDIYIRYKDSYIHHTPTNDYILTDGIKVFEYILSRNILKGFKSIDVFTYENSNLTNHDSFTFSIVDLDNVSFSQIATLSDNSKVINDIPVILKSWFNTLSYEEQIKFTSYIVSRFLSFINNFENRMMNTKINVKLAKTYGPLNNLQYSTEDYVVENVVHSITEATPILGKFYAISDPIDQTDPWYKYAGYLAIWGGSDWRFIKPGEGTIIKNQQDGYIYSTDGRRWFIPNYTNPLDVEIEVFLSTTAGNIYDEILNKVLDYINNQTLIEESIYLSKLYDELHNIPGIKYIRIIRPYSDIIYRDTYKNLNKDQLIKYVPEYVYTTPDKVQIKLSIGR